jgi:hypothetical protein
VIGRIAFQGSADEVQWGWSAASLQGENRFPFALSKNGAIRAEDVPPGTYTLSIRLRRATVDPQVFSEAFGSLQKEVILPSAEDESVPVDLGQSNERSNNRTRSGRIKIKRVLSKPNRTSSD